MAIVINHESNQRDNNDDFNHNRRGHDERRGHEYHNGEGRGHGHGRVRGDYDERFGDDNVVDNHNRNDHNRKDHFIEEGRGEGRERRERHDDDRECHNNRNGHRCHPKVKAPVVLAPIVAVAGGTTVIGAFPDRVAIQVLNNAAVLATYTIVLQPLQDCEEGYVVVETALGITSLTVLGASNVSATALTTAGSYLTLKWNGSIWEQI
ncbi:MAG: hypothetical protein ACRDCA_12505 [Serratia sp. (in: enterobacteria)]|uniref:hypothetical protein n=1 Tax=Serratia sp. (in: enterobacteria) TaxID=616 RepID=UPI003F381779